MSDKQAQISILDFPECVRVRKEMYLPDINYMIYEIVDNCIDEGAAGYANIISVNVNKEKVITIADNGRGIPVTPHKDPRYRGLSQAEVAYTVLHAGGKFGKSDGYKTATGGLHGVGASCVNALAEWLQLEVYCNKKVSQCRFEKGIIVEKMHETSTYDEDISGTSVSFKPDIEIWKEEHIDFNVITKRLEQLAYLNPNITIVVDINTVDHEDKEIVIKKTFSKPNGISEYIHDIVGNKEKLTPVIGLKTEVDKAQITLAFTYINKYNEEINTFVNNISTPDGGDHLIGFRNGIAKVINQYAVENKLIKETAKFDIGDTLEGIIGVVSIKVPQPKFEGQSKSRIKMPEIRTVVRTLVEQSIGEYLDSNPDIAKVIVNKAIIAQKARQNAIKAREAIRKGKLIGDGKPDKFADCRSKDPEETEIWLVEGDSAAGSVKQARNSNTQAVLPIFGKMLNVMKSNYNEVIKSTKVQDLIKALKCGISEDFDISRLRYHKIIISSDADVDGYHIAILFITFFFVYLREIIENGYLYISLPPLYEIKKGKIKRYAFSDIEKDNIVNELGGKCDISRFKGLGEMSPEQFWDTTMDPENRTLIQVTVEDAEAAFEILDICMGDKVEPRKEFIVNNALEAEIDI